MVPLLVGILVLVALLLGALLRGGSRRAESARAPELDPAHDADRPAALSAVEPVAEAAGRSPALIPDAPTPPAPATSSESHVDELRGRVLDPGGAPISAARVALQRGLAREFSVLDLEANRATESIAETTTNAQGEFRFALARGIPVDVVASAPGFVEVRLPDRYAGEHVDVTLFSGYLAFGRITRERDGAPVADARVRVFRLNGPMSLSSETASGADGRYELRFTFRENPMLEVVSRDEQTSDWLRLTLGPDGTVEQDVVLKDGVVVEGRVTDVRTGDPIHGALVGEGWVYRRTATTDADGAYRMPGFGHGNMGLFAKAPGYGESKKGRLPSAVDGVLRVDFELAPGHVARGRIADPSGRPIEGAYVAAVGSGQRMEGQETDWLSATTDDEGRFRIDGLKPKLRHVLFARKHGWATHVWDFPPTEPFEEETDLGDLVLTPPALLAGRVEDESGRGIADVEVTLEGANADRGRLVPDGVGYLFGASYVGDADYYVANRRVRTEELGRFWLAGVAAGSYTLEAKRRGWREASPLPVVVEEGVDQEGLVLRLGGGPEIRGRVVDEGGGPVAGVNVYVTPLDDPARHEWHIDVSAQTAADGEFALRGLLDGEYRLDAYPFSVVENDPDTPWLKTTIESVRAGTEDLMVVMEKGAVIAGVLLDAAGQPLFGHTIHVADGTRTTGGLVRTDFEGRFTLGVPRGAVCDLAVFGTAESGGEGKSLIQPGIVAGTKDLVLRLGE